MNYSTDRVQIDYTLGLVGVGFSITYTNASEPKFFAFLHRKDEVILYFLKSRKECERAENLYISAEETWGSFKKRMSELVS